MLATTLGYDERTGPSPATHRAPEGLAKNSAAKVEWGSAGFPTAFVATYGTEGPVPGFNAEYDALPGLSQKKGVGSHDPLVYNYDARQGPRGRRAARCLSLVRALRPGPVERGRALDAVVVDGDCRPDAVRR
ncbi:hypothetical protein [Streptomyces sp. NL15-2K]|uniref:hypothetical protein n=1 Tax=Streptomyces sp. NL15-2K TaxID=376149 RepID=UPI000FF960DC|nr:MULTISPECIES: hypothetical protein [Actinomycetes]WKX13844.1 hypothetical protein Q4V64_42480 [Kutzneria buriramensis]GCB51992.1 hypothetical protein SNL152K_9348 [Streptomyces sp. NL15-2K]